MKQVHILNGDALKEQLPLDQIPGEIMVARECLVDGPVLAENLDYFIELRAQFLKEVYGADDYTIASSEILKIAGLESGEVNLWFEEDLFCQVNLWFIASLLYLKDIKVNLIMPKDSLRYGFAGLSKDELVSAYQNRIQLTRIQVNQFAILWFAYRKDHIERLLKLGVQMYSDFPFVMKAIEAHFERQPRDGKPGLPEQTLLEIIKEKSTDDFGIVFREFADRLPIYGFGDLQVRRIFESIIDSQNQD